MTRADLFGRVFRNLDGIAGFNGTADEPIAGALVQVGGRNVTTDANGLYTATQLAAGAYSISGSANGYNPATVGAVLRAGATVEQDLTLTPVPSDVAIEFRDEGQGVAGIPIRLEGPVTRTVTTNSTGMASTSLEPGHYSAVIDYSFENEAGLEVTYKQTNGVDVAFGGEDQVFVIDAT